MLPNASGLVTDRPPWVASPLKEQLIGGAAAPIQRSQFVKSVTRAGGAAAAAAAAAVEQGAGDAAAVAAAQIAAAGATGPGAAAEPGAGDALDDSDSDSDNGSRASFDYWR